MPNMSYCRFENTLSDLRDCAHHLDDNDLPTDEFAARVELILLCQHIAEVTADDSVDSDDFIEDNIIEDLEKDVTE